MILVANAGIVEANVTTQIQINASSLTPLTKIVK